MAFYSFYSLYKHPVEIRKNYKILKWTNVNTIYDMRGHLIMRTITRSKKSIRFRYSLFIPTYKNLHNWLFMFAKWCGYIFYWYMLYLDNWFWYLALPRTQYYKLILLYSHSRNTTNAARKAALKHTNWFVMSNITAVCVANFFSFQI